MNLLRVGSKVGSLHVIVIGFSFLASVFLVKSLDANLYGKYIYLVSIIAILPLLFNSFDQILIRFGSVEKVEKQILYLKGIIFCKKLIFLLSLVFLYVWMINFELILLEDKLFIHLLIIMLIKELVLLVQNSLKTIININEKYMIISSIEFIRSATYACVIISAYFLSIDSHNMLMTVVYFNLISELLIFIYVFNTASKLLENKLFNLSFRINSIKLIFNKEKLNYFGPLQLVSFQSYLKQYLPQILLGKIATYNEVAYYEVIKKIYNIIHKFTPKMTELFLPSIIKTKTKDEMMFIHKMNSFGIYYTVAISFISLVIFYSDELILNMFSLTYFEGVNSIFLLFSLNLIVGSIGQLNNIIIKTSDTTKGILYASIIRTVIGSVLLVYLVSNYGLYGASFSKLIDTIILSVVLIYYSSKSFPIAINLKLTLILICNFAFYMGVFI